MYPTKLIKKSSTAQIATFIIKIDYDKHKDEGYRSALKKTRLECSSISLAMAQRWQSREQSLRTLHRGRAGGNHQRTRGLVGYYMENMDLREEQDKHLFRDNPYGAISLAGED